MAEVTDSPVHLAGKRSREAAMARDKEAWLAVFADDAIVEDPIGPSHFDPDGNCSSISRRPTSAATRKPTSATS
jgi:hypothetical protein